jgi:hypothetical protein
MDKSDETCGSGIDGKRDRGSDTNLLARVSETAEEADTISKERQQLEAEITATEGRISGCPVFIKKGGNVNHRTEFARTRGE